MKKKKEMKKIMTEERMNVNADQKKREPAGPAAPSDYQRGENAALEEPHHRCGLYTFSIPLESHRFFTSRPPTSVHSSSFVCLGAAVAAPCFPLRHSA